MRTYGDRIRQIEHGSFTPLVFSTSGGMSRQTKVFFKRLSELMSEKKGENIGYFSAWLRTKISFALIKCLILCLRGTRSGKKNNHNNINAMDYEWIVTESGIKEKNKNKTVRFSKSIGHPSAIFRGLAYHQHLH